MKKWKLVAGVVLVFACGALLGSLGTEIYHRYLSDRFHRDPEVRKAFILQKFTARLDLSADQQAAFKGIIDRIDAQRRSEVVRSRAELKRLWQESYQEMQKVLRPDQQGAFEAFIKEIRNRRRRRSG